MWGHENYDELMEHLSSRDGSHEHDRLSAGTVVELLRAANSEQQDVIRALDARIQSEGISAERSRQVTDAISQLQNTRSHLSRRSQELTALLATARELVQLHDVGTVLSRLVQRAHELIGTDVTYLAETEAGADGMRVRHSVGTVTEIFRNLFVPAGKGLANKVVEARAPVWVARYDDMVAAPRDPSIDSSVEAEGLVSFLGVPMMVGEEIIGALFACNRFEHEYTPEQIALLSAFADHAALALNSARLLGRSELAAQRAEIAYRELADHVTDMERTNRVHETLTAAVVAGGSIGEITDTLSQALSRPVIALDARLKRVTSSPNDCGPLPQAHLLASAVAESRDSGRCATVTVRGTQWITIAIVGADSVTGAIIVPVVSGEHREMEGRLLERAAHVAALLSLKQDAVDSARANRRSRILNDILDGFDPARADPAHELKSLHGPIQSAAALWSPGGELTRRSRRLVQLIGDTGIFTIRGENLVVLWAEADCEKLTERLRAHLVAENRNPTTAVYSSVTTSGIVRAVERVTGCLELLPSFGVEGVSVPAVSLVPYQALVSSEPGSAEQFVAEMLGPIVAWDERRGTDLFGTLSAYFDTSESGSGTARKLHVHKNTIQQRLERIGELTGGAFSDPEYRFRMHAAVRLRRLRTDLVRSATNQPESTAST